MSFPPGKSLHTGQFSLLVGWVGPIVVKKTQQLLMKITLTNKLEKI
jgi:hypothetical protein